jgi:SNF2 family DNA or RNA helicase
MQADITTDGEYVLAKIPYAGGAGKDWAKMVPGAKPKYEKREGQKDKFVCWQYPLTMDTCRSFRRVFGAQLTIRQPLSDWARAAIKAGEMLEEMRSGATVKLSRTHEEAPFLAAAIEDRPYQASGVGFMTLAGQGILGDEPGLGKTLQTIATLIECDAKNILVGCPRTATYATWEREVNRWAPGIATFVAQGSHQQREDVMKAFYYHTGGRKMLIINNEMIRAKRIEICPDGVEQVKSKWPMECLEDSDHMKKHKTIVEHEWPFLFEQTWDAVVIDEAHNMLASTANVQSKRITQGRYGAILLRKRVSKDGGLAIALSGTPGKSNLTRLWGTLNWCRPDVFGSYWRFAETHFGVTEGRYSKVIQPDAKGKPAKVPKPLDDAAWDAAIRPYYLARTKEMAAPDLPPIIYTGTPSLISDNSSNYIWLDMEPKQHRAYREMADLAEAHILNGRLMANGTLAEISRLRQFAITYGRMDGEDFRPALPSNKIDWFMQFMEEREGSDAKIIVASSFTQIVHLIEGILNDAGIHTLTLTGATSDRKRLELVQQFNDPDSEVQVAILNSKAGGESITLDACCDEMVIMDPLWTDDAQFQLVSRIHRVSRMHQVTVHRPISIGTVEEWIAVNTDEQRAVVQSSKPKAREVAALEAVRWGK